MRSGIDELIDTTRAFGQIGTSRHVKQEFFYVYGGFFATVEGAIRGLDAMKEAPFSDLWEDVQESMPQGYPGGYKIFEHLSNEMLLAYGKRSATRTFVRNVVGAYKEDIFSGFIDENVSDHSSCDVWEAPPGSCSLCDIEPSDDCRLQDTCVINRANFLASATTLAGAGRKESKWLKKNLDTLHNLEGKPVHEFLGKHPGHAGDLIIFWEVPDDWVILSRDVTFKILKKAHREEIDFFMVRLPRQVGDKACTVRIADDETAQALPGTLKNFSSTGARIHAPGFAVRVGQRIEITADNLETRVGEVIEAEQSTDATLQDDDLLNFGVKFKVSRAKG